MKTLPAPPSTRVEEVVDELHGHRIVDPYRWLEDAASLDTEAWVAEQNAYTRSLLDDLPVRDPIHRRLAELLSIGTVGTPAVRSGRYFYTRRDGNENQPRLFLRVGEGEERVLLDPNSASADGLVTLDWWYPSRDGRLLAYGYSSNGDERSTLHVLDVDTGTLLPDRIEHTRYASVGWLADGSGFYYTRYPAPGTVPEGEENYHVRVFFHGLGSTRDADPEVFGADLAPEDMPQVDVSPDGRWLVLTVSHGWERCDLYLRDLHAEDGRFVPVAVGQDALFFGRVAGDTLFIHTNLDAPRFRLCAADPLQPEQARWQEIIAEREDAVLNGVALVGGRIVAHYLRNATSSVSVHGPDGARLRDVRLPGLGTVTGISGEWEASDVFFGYESFTSPPSVYRLAPDGSAGTLWATVAADLDPEAFTVRQEWYTSADGTRISMFIVHRTGLDRSRPHPTLLTGYGGFNIDRTPIFDRGLYLWLEHGGVFALPNLRGGGEYGEEWHRAGMLDRKQNVFDDFIAAAEYLIEQGYTEPAQLGISGRSNGGLLVGAALTQRPDLFRAVVCGVPLLDMLRYHHFLIARLWIPEYGSADDSEQFSYLHAYSPYHHVRAGTEYPAVLLETAESDTRVDPLHARKMAALLQSANASEHPVLIRVETRAGHGIGKPLSKVVEEQTDTWSFLFWQLGMSA